MLLGDGEKAGGAGGGGLEKADHQLFRKIVWPQRIGIMEVEDKDEYRAGKEQDAGGRQGQLGMQCQVAENKDASAVISFAYIK